MSFVIRCATPEDQAQVVHFFNDHEPNGRVLLAERDEVTIAAAGTEIIDGKYAVLHLACESEINFMPELMRLWIAANEHLDAMYVRAEGAHPVFLHDGFAVAKELPPGVAEVIGNGVVLVKVPKKRSLLTA